MTPKGLGIFARTYDRGGSAEAVAKAVADDGFDVTQLNLTAVGQPTLPDPANQLDLIGIRRHFESAGVFIWGLSGTYNMIDPDAQRRQQSTDLAAALIRRSPEVGCDVVTVCTGSRDPSDMWRRHPGNGLPDAWSDLRESLDVLLEAATESGVKLGIEPEPGNVVVDAAAAAKLLGELGSSAASIGVVLDSANLVRGDQIDDQREILAEAFDLLGPHVVAIHAKDVRRDGVHCAAGLGALDYRHIFELVARHCPAVPIIVQDAAEADVARTRNFLLRHMEVVSS